MARLQSLSPALLRQIIDWDPGLLPLFLYRLGSRSLFEATREGIYRDLVVTDTSITSFENAKALTVYAAPGYGEHVRRLIIRPPGVLACDSPTSKGLERLQDNVLFDLLSCLSGLAVIEWRADRLPPIELCTVLGGVAPSLKDFVFELAERSFTTARERRASTTGGTACDEGEDDEDDEDDTAKGPLRWDAPHFDSLPITSLARLSLCGLSATGSHVLTSILSESSIPLLNDIELAKTRFVDDQLMRSIANGAKRIERISILEMHGTRLTTEGIAAVMTGLMLLRELEIVDVEGRFNKMGWIQLDYLPSSLETIRFAYREDRAHHTWTFQHLENIISLLSLSPNKLQRLCVSRIVPAAAMVPGGHALYPHLAMNNLTTPRKITKEQIATIVEDGRALKELDVDWWTLSFDGFETIVKRCSNLEVLKVMLDAPIQKLVTSTSFGNSKLKKLIISIPPEHTPQLAAFSASGSSPIFELKTPPSPSTQRMGTTPPSPKPSAPPDPNAPPIQIREWRRFLKKASHLREVAWTGRGGLGTWRFERSGLNAKADFTPMVDLLPASALAEDVAGSPASGFASSGHRSSISLHGSPFIPHGAKRRTQSFAESSNYSSAGPNSDRSRRSSAASTAATSWTGGSNVLGLEGIPGTPTTDDPSAGADVGQGLVEQLAGADLSSSPRKGKGRKASMAKKFNLA